MKPQFFEFMNQASHLVTDPVNRSKVISAAVAVAIARTQNLPSTEVENAESYFTGQMLPRISQLISEFNEEVVFDTVACLQQVRQLWHLRYGAAFGAPAMIYMDTCNFFDAFTGVDRFIDDKFKCFATENSRAITALSQFAMTIVDCPKG